jgi:hypothetical protein
LASDAPNDEQLGVNVALDGNTAVLASKNLDRALVFVGSGGSWTQQAVLPSPNSASGHREVAISGNLIVASDPSGLATFRRSGGTWSAESTVVPADDLGARPVDAVAVDSATLVAVTPGGDREDGGRAFIYGLSSSDNDAMPEEDSLYLSVASTTVLGGVTAQDEDIVRYEEETGLYDLLFDGSDVGLAGHGIDAFSVRADDSILMSFDSSFTLAGVGVVRPQDVVRFVPSSTGADTAGTFQPFFVGTEHGLTASDANVTGVYEARDGRLFLNFGAPVHLGSMHIYTEDIVQFLPESNSYSMIFDGTDMGLGPYSLGAFDFQPDGRLLINLTAYPTSAGLPGLAAGVKHDAFMFTPTAYPIGYGPDTSGTFQPYFVGSGNGAPATLKIDGLSRLRLPPPASVYQAEWAVLAGNSIVEKVNAGYAGASYVNSAVNGGSIEFRDVPGSFGGSRILRFRTALASGTRTGRLVVNGVARNVAFRSTGSWSNWVDTDFVVTLKAGKNTIRLESTGQDLASIDQMTILASYQAESGQVAGGTVVENTNAGFTGTAYVNSSVHGGTLTLTGVSGDSGGPRMLRVRYALGSHARSGRLSVNEVPQSIAFTSTDSWTTWQTIDIPVDLAAASVNTIRFESTGEDLPNIDSIEVF